MSQAQETIAEVVQAGRPGSGMDAGAGDGPSAPARHPEDAALSEIMDRYDQFGNVPPRFNIAANDAAHSDNGAHTVERHGPDVPLRRDPSGRTVEGRIYGDDPWGRPENWSLRWTDPSTMNRAVNDYVRQHWEAIRSDLALDGEHSGGFVAGHRVGEGYHNRGMYGAGPREAQYTATSLVRVFIQIVPGSDPPQPFIVTAFPAGLL